MAEYFIYHMRKTWVRFAVLASILCILANASVCLKSYNSYTNTTSISGNVIIFSIFIMAAPLAVAGLEFGQFMNRRNLDTWFSLPISRVNLFLTHFLNGAAQLTVSLLAGIVVACAKLAPYPKFRIGEVWSFFWVALGLMLLLYMLLSFLFVCANNVFDGCVFMLGSYMIPNSIFTIVRACSFGNLENLLKTSNADGALLKWFFNGYTLYMEMLKAGIRYTSSLEVSTRDTGVSSYVYDYLDEFVEANIPNILIWTMLSVAALAGAVFVFSRKKTEKVNGVSDSWFGYRILIPIVAAGHLMSSAVSVASASNSSFGVFSLILPIPTFIGIFVAFIIFRRGIKLKISDLITMGGLVILYIVSAIVFKAMA